MFDHKIVFTGPTGSGKTTAIQTYSDIEPVLTEVKASDETKNLKENTTVAMDYGSVTLDSETRLHLYGTPGQARFEFMWEILGKGSHGLIILMDHTDPNALEKLNFYLDKFSFIVKNVPVVIGINKIDSPVDHPLTMSDYENAIAAIGENIAVLGVDVRKEEDVRMLIMSLLFAMPKTLQQTEAVS